MLVEWCDVSLSLEVKTWKPHGRGGLMNMPAKTNLGKKFIVALEHLDNDFYFI